MKFDIWSVLIIVFICQGLFFLTSLIISSKRRKKKENSFLIAIILVLLWYLFEFLSIRNVFNVGFNLFYGTRYGSWFLLGPLIYFYFKSITDHDWKFSKKEWLHFLPFLFFVIILPLFFDGVLNRRQVHYGMISVFDFREKEISTIQYVYSVVFIFQFLHLGYYLFKNLQLVRQYAKGVVSEYANLEANVKWLKILIISLLAILIFSVVFLYILLETDIYRRHLDYIYVLPIGVLFYIIGYHLMNVDWKVIDKKIVKYANSSLSIENIPEYLDQIERLINDDKIYLDNQIRLNDLAQKINIKSHHLSQIINQHYQQSFFDFINQHRIVEAKSIITKNLDQPLIQVAFDAGFNNKTSFVNAFKKFEKKTPSKFKEELLSS